MKIKEHFHKYEHEQITYCYDKESGLEAIIAIHDTTLGPALGGCRFWNYPSYEEALFDVVRLSRGMTYKAAVAGLPLGGGKSVIIGDPKKLKSEKLFRAFGQYVNGLAGRYITAEDVNINVSDVNQIAKETRYVTGVTVGHSGSGDPSPVTALGVFCGIKAAVKASKGRDSLEGLTVAVQGCGAVGSYLCYLLHQEGAKLIVADVNAEVCAKMATLYRAIIVPVDQIHRQPADIYSPCALGGIVNAKTIPDIQAKIVAGAANNQLLNEEADMDALRARGILYAPDYVINAGGLINVCHELRGYDEKAAKDEARKIYHTLSEIFERAKSEDISTLEASNRIVQMRLRAAREKNGKKMIHCYDNQTWIKARS